MRKPILIGTLAIGFVAACAAFIFVRGFEWQSSPWAQGRVVETFDGVSVYENGPVFSVSHGRHYAPDGYYFGQKWQCVEFIKRYLYEAKGHRMPDVMGHAASFYDPAVPHGGFNTRRGMTQYSADRGERPKPGDLMVFGGVAGYGHVGIAIAVTNDFVVVAQQNKPPAREGIQMVPGADGRISFKSGLPVVGWLRVPERR